METQATDTRKTSPVLLAVAGLISATFSDVTSFAPNVQTFSVGLFFGLALIGYFIGFEKRPDPLKGVLLVCVSTAAWPFSEIAAVGASAIHHAFTVSDSQNLDIPWSIFFVGGTAGALLVLTGGAFLYGTRGPTWGTALRVLPWSLGGGALAAIAGLAQGAQAHGTYGNWHLLFFVWQPGTALFLGLLLRALPSRRKILEPQRAHRNLIAALVIFAPILGILIFLAVRSAQAERDSQRVANAAKRYEADAPSTLDLQRVDPLQLDQALILHEIRGLHPLAPFTEPTGRSSTSYIVGYTATQDHPVSSSPIERLVTVEVVQTPNAEWARYIARNPRLNVAVLSPESLTKLSKDNQTIVEDSYARTGAPCFHWPSGAFVISVCYDMQRVDEAFLSEYLEKYPSSL